MLFRLCYFVQECIHIDQAALYKFSFILQEKVCFNSNCMNIFQPCDLYVEVPGLNFGQNIFCLE
jgi:hypothetical protein